MVVSDRRRKPFHWARGMDATHIDSRDGSEMEAMT
jgi:hypothetical protein